MEAYLSGAAAVDAAAAPEAGAVDASAAPEASVVDEQVVMAATALARIFLTPLFGLGFPATLAAVAAFVVAASKTWVAPTVPSLLYFVFSNGATAAAAPSSPRPAGSVAAAASTVMVTRAGSEALMVVPGQSAWSPG